MSQQHYSVVYELSVHGSFQSSSAPSLLLLLVSSVFVGGASILASAASTMSSVGHDGDSSGSAADVGARGGRGGGRAGGDTSKNISSTSSTTSNFISNISSIVSSGSSSSSSSSSSSGSGSSGIIIDGIDPTNLHQMGPSIGGTVTTISSTPSDSLINKFESGQAVLTASERTGIMFEIEALMYILYGSLAVAAVTSNIIVCYIVLSSQRMRTATNYFIVNLAVGDILMALLCIPFGFVSNLIYQYWPFGAAMCVIVSYAQANSVFVSAYTMVAISIDRYLAIMYPLRLRMTKQQSKIIILVIWSAAILTSMPTAILSGLVPRPNMNDKYTCIEQWSSPQSRYYYSMALMVLQFILPLFVLVITYTRIAIVVWGKRTPGEAENARDARIARSKRKMIKMVIFCVIAFALTWLPFNALMVIGDYHPAIYEVEWIIYIWFVSHYLAMCHTITNPVIYCWMNNRFRHGFRMVFYNCCKLVCCCIKCKAPQFDEANQTRHPNETGSCTQVTKPSSIYNQQYNHTRQNGRKYSSYDNNSSNYNLHQHQQQHNQAHLNANNHYCNANATFTSYQRGSVSKRSAGSYASLHKMCEEYRFDTNETIGIAVSNSLKKHPTHDLIDNNIECINENISNNNNEKQPISKVTVESRSNQCLIAIGDDNNISIATRRNSFSFKDSLKDNNQSNSQMLNKKCHIMSRNRQIKRHKSDSFKHKIQIELLAVEYLEGGKNRTKTQLTKEVREVKEQDTNNGIDINYLGYLDEQPGLEKQDSDSTSNSLLTNTTSVVLTTTSNTNSNAYNYANSSSASSNYNYSITDSLPSNDEKKMNKLDQRQIIDHSSFFKKCVGIKKIVNTINDVREGSDTHVDDFEEDSLVVGPNDNHENKSLQMNEDTRWTKESKSISSDGMSKFEVAQRRTSRDLLGREITDDNNKIHGVFDNNQKVDEVDKTNSEEYDDEYRDWEMLRIVGSAQVEEASGSENQENIDREARYSSRDNPDEIAGLLEPNGPKDLETIKNRAINRELGSFSSAHLRSSSSSLSYVLHASDKSKEKPIELEDSLTRDSNPCEEKKIRSSNQQILSSSIEDGELKVIKPIEPIKSILPKSYHQSASILSSKSDTNPDERSTNFIDRDCMRKKEAALIQKSPTVYLLLETDRTKSSILTTTKTLKRYGMSKFDNGYSSIRNFNC